MAANEIAAGVVALEGGTRRLAFVAVELVGLLFLLLVVGSLFVTEGVPFTRLTAAFRGTAACAC